MNYTELSNMVADITARPDLVSETRVAISGAIRKFHLADTFQADLRTVSLNMGDYPTTGNVWDIDTKSSIFTRFRKLYHASTLPRTNTFHSGVMPSMRDDFRSGPTEIPIVSPADLLDEYGGERKNYVCLAGDNLRLRLVSASNLVQLLYFTLPDITVTSAAVNYSSWIVDQMPEAVAMEASATIFKMIGKTDEFQRHQIMFGENLALLRQTAVMPN